MPKILLLSVFLFFIVLSVKGQEGFTVKGDTLKRTDPRADTTKPYVNLGKIAAKKAIFRSAVIPGWGQVGNGLNVYRGLKVAAIYTGGFLLVQSYIQNSNNLKQYNAELQYRDINGVSSPNSVLSDYSYSGLVTASDIFRRNREVVIFSLIGLYAVNIIDAYVDARLKYFDVGNDLAMKISPAVINANPVYGFNAHSFTPGLRLSFAIR